MIKYRYPGTTPFETYDQHIFFGRKQDVEKFITLLNVEKLIVLYAKSGLGKSSLVNAGIIPQLQQNKHYLSWRIRFTSFIDKGSSLPPVDSFVRELQKSSPAPLPWKVPANTQDPASLLFWQLKAIEQSAPHRRMTFACFFDQFEEFFSYPEPQQEHWKSLIAQLLRSEAPREVEDWLEANAGQFAPEELAWLLKPLNIKVTLVVRADRLNLVNTLRNVLPFVLHNSYELGPLNSKQAREAIEQPARQEGEFSTPAFAYSQSALEQILGFLSAQESKPIETFQLQILCKSLEQKISGDKRSIRPEDLGDLDQVFRQYYDFQIATLPQAGQLAARRFIEEKLIMEHRRLSLDKALCLTMISAQSLQILEQSRLIRPEPNSLGGTSYEVSHDTLIDPIEAARDERLAREREETQRREQEEERQRQAEALRKAQEKAEADRLEKEKTQKQLRTVRILLGIAVIALMIAIAGIMYALKQKQIAEQKEKEAIANLKAFKEEEEKRKQQKIENLLSTAIALEGNGELQQALSYLQQALEMDSSRQDIRQKLEEVKKKIK